MSQPNTTAEKLAQLRDAARRRIGLDGYAQILATLMSGPKSTVKLAALRGVSHNAILATMRHCLRMRLVHRVSWHRPAPHARMVPCWALGADGDISMPQFEERTRRPRRAPSQLILLTTVLDLLTDNALTRNELIDELRMCRESVERIIIVLRTARLVYVQSWVKPAVGTTVAEFRAGRRNKDAPRPPVVSNDYSRERARRQSQIQMMQALAGMGAAA